MSSFKIPNSSAIQKRDFSNILDLYDNEVTRNRTRRSLLAEWAAHNWLYDLGIAREHTREVDFEYPQKWYLSIGYAIVGAIGWLFIE